MKTLIKTQSTEYPPECGEGVITTFTHKGIIHFVPEDSDLSMFDYCRALLREKKTRITVPLEVFIDYKN